MTKYCPRCRGHHRKAKRNYEDEATAQVDADRMTGELEPDWPFEVYRCPLGNIHVGVPKRRFRIGPQRPVPPIDSTKDV